MAFPSFACLLLKFEAAGDHAGRGPQATGHSSHACHSAGRGVAGAKLGESPGLCPPPIHPSPCVLFSEAWSPVGHSLKPITLEKTSSSLRRTIPKHNLQELWIHSCHRPCPLQVPSSPNSPDLCLSRLASFKPYKAEVPPLSKAFRT